MSVYVPQVFSGVKSVTILLGNVIDVWPSDDSDVHITVSSSKAELDLANGVLTLAKQAPKPTSGKPSGSITIMGSASRNIIVTGNNNRISHNTSTHMVSELAVIVTVFIPVGIPVFIKVDDNVSVTTGDILSDLKIEAVGQCRLKSGRIGQFEANVGSLLADIAQMNGACTIDCFPKDCRLVITQGEIDYLKVGCSFFMSLDIKAKVAGGLLTTHGSLAGNLNADEATIFKSVGYSDTLKFVQS